MDERIRVLRENAKSINEPVLRDKTLELLIKTVKERSPRKMLEIGTSFGLTGCALLTLNSDLRITSIEIDEEKVKIAKKNFETFNVQDRVKIITGDATEIIPILSGEYDLIFLDGPKGHYYEYLPYLKALLSKGGILFTDDILFHGYVKGKAPHKHATIKHSIEKFLDDIQNDKGLKTQIIEIEDGVSITEKL